MASPKPVAEQETHPPSFGKGLTSQRSMAQLLHPGTLYQRAMLHASAEATPIKLYQLGFYSLQVLLLCTREKLPLASSPGETCCQLLPQVAQPCSSFMCCGLQELCPRLQPPLDRGQLKECDLHTRLGR